MQLKTLRPYIALGHAPRKAVSRSRLPRRWLLTDPRQPNPLAVIARLPSGCGVILRHYDDAERAALARQVSALCRRRGLVLLIAGDERLAIDARAAGVHLPEAAGARAGAVKRRHPRWIVTCAAHGAAAIRAAREADAVLVSPVFPTRSHPGAPTLGPVRFASLACCAKRLGLRVYALGGVNDCSFQRLRGSRPAGFAGIDAFA